MSPPPPSPPPPPPPSDQDPGSTDGLTPGMVLADRYEIVRRVGEGGMGTVYQARHVAMDRPCALKILHPGLSRDREALERFQREARNASRINHPNVCTIYDYGVDAGGRVFLVMEFVAGRSLGAILAEQGTLPLHRTARLLAGAAAGLDAAHGLGLVHRDLKPDNMMVTGTGRDEQVKLVDFGIAKALEATGGGGDQDVTAAGVVIGTPEYMAPEQFARDPVDTSVDVYALGLIGYRMLSGRIPHRAATARETLTLRLTEPAAPITTIEAARELPEILDQVFEKALARRPDQRWPSAGAFANAVLAVAASVPEPAGADATLRLEAPTRIVDLGLGPTRRMVRRRRITGVVVAAAALTAAVVFWPRPPAPAVGTDPPVVPVNDSGAGAAPRDTAGMGPVNTGSPSTAPGATTPPPAPAPPPVRAPPPPAAAAPTLPSVDEILEPATREPSRQRAQQVYSSDARPELKARAAHLIAQSYMEDRSWDDAELWIRLAIARNAEAPADADRARRDGQYRFVLSEVQARKREEPPPQ